MVHTTVRPTEARILRAFQRYRFMTAEQVRRLLYGRGSLKYASSNLLSLVRKNMVCNDLFLSHQGPTGRAPMVYYLGPQGWRYLAANGYDVPPRWQKRRQPIHTYIMEHTLSVTDTLTTIELFVRDHPEYRIARMLHDLDLARQAFKVKVDDKSSTYAPDGWMDLRVRGGQMCFAFEVDRGTEDQKRWRAKIAAIVSWLNGPYQEWAGHDVVTVAIVAARGLDGCDEIPARIRRANQLRYWTEQELTKLGKTDIADLLLFAPLRPDDADPDEFCTAPKWVKPFGKDPIALLSGT